MKYESDFEKRECMHEVRDFIEAAVREFQTLIEKEKKKCIYITLLDVELR